MGTLGEISRTFGKMFFGEEGLNDESFDNVLVGSKENPEVIKALRDALGEAEKMGEEINEKQTKSIIVRASERVIRAGKGVLGNLEKFIKEVKINRKLRKAMREQEANSVSKPPVNKVKENGGNNKEEGTKIGIRSEIPLKAADIPKPRGDGREDGREKID